MLHVLYMCVFVWGHAVNRYFSSASCLVHCMLQREIGHARAVGALLSESEVDTSVRDDEQPETAPKLFRKVRGVVALLAIISIESITATEKYPTALAKLPSDQIF